MKRFGKKIKWMIFNLLAPEWLLGKAWSDLMSATLLEEKFHEFADTDNVPWMKSHVFLANMGGFAIRFATLNQDVPRVERHCEGTDARDQSCVIQPPIDLPVLNTSRVTEACAARQQGTGTEVSVGSTNPHYNDSEPLRPILTPASQRRTLRRKGNLPIPSQVFVPAEQPRASSREHPRDDIPAEIRRQLEIWSEKLIGSTCSENIFVGTSLAHDKSNSENVIKAIPALRQSHFKGPWEKFRFYASYRRWFANMRLCQGDTWIVDANQLLLLRKLEIINSLPRLSEDSLEDRNKSDALVKLFAVGQVGWLVIQLVTRLCRNLPISQLEIVTLAFAACSGVTYILLLQKPKDVQTSIEIDAARCPTPEEMIRIAVCGPYTFGTGRDHPWIPNNALHREQEMGGNAMLYMTIGTLFGAFVFGAIHCLAWNNTFPTTIERKIWRVASVVTTVTTPIEVLIVVMFRKIAAPNGFKLPKYKHSTKIWLFILSIPYGLARLFVLVEIFRCLFYLPVDGFVTTWASNVPHIS